MRVFSQINKCQQKKSKKQKTTTTKIAKINKNKRGVPLLGLAESIY